MWGIVTLTKGGALTAKRISSEFSNVDVFVKDIAYFPGAKLIGDNFKGFVESIFSKYDVLIFIMATGIVVRTIAALINDKTTDPAVIVVDEKGEFIISLLSGHIGGANEVSKMIADKIKGQAVITTSSDVNNILSVDMIALYNDLIIDDMSDAKKITAMMVNGKKVCLISDIKNINYSNLLSDVSIADGLIVITNKIVSYEKPFVKLIPKNIVAGIGCKKGVSEETVFDFIKEVFTSNKIELRALKTIGSIDLKSDEEGIIKSAKKLNVPFVTFSALELSKVVGVFSSSDFVKEVTGVNSVCEPSAVLASGKDGDFLQKKIAKNGVTLAIWEEF